MINWKYHISLLLRTNAKFLRGNQYICKRTLNVCEFNTTFQQIFFVFQQETLYSLTKLLCSLSHVLHLFKKLVKTVWMLLWANAKFLRVTQYFCKRMQVLQANTKFFWETQFFIPPRNFAFARIRKSIEISFFFFFLSITSFPGKHKTFARKCIAFPQESLHSLAKLNWNWWWRGKKVLLQANAEFLRETQFCKRTQTFCEQTQSF